MLAPLETPSKGSTLRAAWSKSNKEEIAAVLDNDLLSTLPLFIACSHGVVKLGGWFRRSAPHSSVRWCGKMKCLSVIDTGITILETGQSKSLTRCLLWPELKDCDQRCIK
jgi:hypothetical protein